MPRRRNQVSSPDPSDRPITNLVTIRIERIAQANRVFGEITENGWTPLVLVPHHRFAGRLVVPHGFDTIVAKNGNTLGVFKPGVYYLSHFYQVTHLVCKRKIPYHSKVASVPTKDNLRIDVHVDFLVHVRDSFMLMKTISAENMEELLIATHAEALRSMARTVRADQAYDLCGSDTTDMQAALNEKMNPYGVAIDKVTITAVSLPPDVTERLKSTATFEFKHVLEAKKQELRLRQMNETQVIASAQQLRKNEESHEQELAKKARQQIEQEIVQIEERNRNEMEQLQGKLDSEVARIRAEADLEVGRIDAERVKLVTEIKAGGAIEANKILVQSQRESDRIKAETSLQVAQIKAQITAIRASSEKSAESLKLRRGYLVERKRLSVLRSLAKNPEVVICGEESDSIFASLAASVATAELVGMKPGKR